jgi:hypothetical protein
VDFRGLLISLLSHKRHVDIGARHSILFGQPMRQDRRNSAVKELENPVVNVPQPNSQFVDAVAKKVGFRTPQFVPHF